MGTRHGNKLATQQSGKQGCNTTIIGLAFRLACQLLFSLFSGSGQPGRE
jgi:hypothetical protein